MQAASEERCGVRRRETRRGKRGGRRRRRPTRAVGAALAACLCGVWPGTAGPVMAGRTVPDFRFNRFDGKRMELSDLTHDGPVLVQFWESCCLPCHRALAELDSIRATYGDRGLTVIAISIDQSRNISKARSLVKVRGYDFATFVDPNRQAFRRVHGRTVPYTLLIAPGGAQLFTHTGFREGDERLILEKVAAVMEERPQPAEEASGEGGGATAPASDGAP